MAKSKGGIFKKVFIIFLFALIGYASYWTYTTFFKSNVHLNGKKYTHIYIKTNATLNDVLDELYSKNIITHHESFEWMARKMNLQSSIIPGKYRIDAKMSNRSIIKILKNGKQEKVKLSLNSQIRTKEQFVIYISEKLQIEEEELKNYCSNNILLKEKYNLSSENFMALILPKTYEVNWAISIEELFNLIEKPYKEFWNKERLSKAKNIGYSVPEIITIASIVQCESNINSEQKIIAGVYFNRLKTGMKLQADPTIVFANQKFDAQRVLSADKEIDSPYNTYRYKGLPPGPICLVIPSVIDAVLYYTKHRYTYFCAKPDFSGYSDFTNDYNEHLKNARAYQEALNKRGIMK